MTSLKQAGKIIFSTANAACKHFVKLKYDNKYRLKFKTVAVEGADVIADLVTSGKEIECLLTDDLEPHNLILSASKVTFCFFSNGKCTMKFEEISTKSLYSYNIKRTMRFNDFT